MKSHGTESMTGPRRLAFEIYCVAPGSLRSAGIAIAACKAGAHGILDLELCDGPELMALGLNNLRSMFSAVPDSERFGIRVSADQLKKWKDLRDLLDSRSLWLVLTNWDRHSSRQIQELASDGSRLWLELTNPDQIGHQSLDALQFRGVVGRGSETGGWSGSVSAYILAQALSRQHRPFLVQGGIGFDAAAACHIAGAAGVVLDDQLLLCGNHLPPEWRHIVSRLSAEDTTAVGKDGGVICRFVARSGMAGASALKDALAEDVNRFDNAADGSRSAASGRLRWGDPSRFGWPVGQGIAMAAGWAERFRTVGKAVHELRNRVDEIVNQAAEHRPFAPGSPIAAAHRTRFPVVQGPMTRVSDAAEFAKAVADAGGLPMIAMALLRTPASSDLLRSTREKLGDQPWGVGILGFVPQDIRDEQLQCIREIRPPFALISGGRPDQAAELQRNGIETYLHVPVPGLVRPYFERGVRNFIFEGSECGGHTGPLTSFTLWGHAVETLLNELPSAQLSEMSILLAGGIHDALSAGMASAFAARLSAKGTRVGLLMGTAYLFTKEIVESGAVAPEFQSQAIRCHSTATVVTGPGHIIRCAPTPFVREFQRTREELAAGSRTPAEISRSLEDLTLGRARAASKGIWRDSEGNFSRLDPEEQAASGMYMMGEVAAFHDAVVSVETLHREVSEGATRIVSEAVCLGQPIERCSAPPEPIALIGMSCLVPGADSPEKFWRNLLDRTSAIREIPTSRFDWRLYFDENSSAEDKMYAKWGGFLSEIPFDPVSFGIPPKSLKSISVAQLLALESTRRALADAGYESGNFDRENTSVVFGTSSAADLQQFYITRSTLPACVGDVPATVRDRLPTWTEESFPGTLMNVMAGRVANRLDLGGMNCAVDAACASSLAALQIAVADLQSHRCNMAVAGGVDVDQTPHAYIAFSKTKALSPKGEACPFDRNADGIVLSEAVVLFVVKRLADAERDGDRIYAAIRAIEGSSDGKGLGLTAPRSVGQRRALSRAYNTAAVGPATIGLYEAHGTGTAVGDRAELETISSTLRNAGAPAGQCAIGSAKSLLGHAKAAAGAVGLLKTTLAIYHRTLPPHAGIREPLERLLDANSPVVCYDQPSPWLQGSGPRRAGVSAFGFGGTNFHAVLEEYVNSDVPVGSLDWPAELFVFVAADAAGLATQLQQLDHALSERPNVPLRDLAFAAALSASARGTERVRLAIVAQTHEKLKNSISKALLLVAENRMSLSGPDIFLRHAQQCPGGDVAFLFPGQGSQYPGMGREAAVYLQEVRTVVELADTLLDGSFDAPLSRYTFPPAAFSKEQGELQASRLAATEVAQPAIGTLSCGLLDFVRRLGIVPSRVAGHSYGEYTALYAAGAFSREALLRLSAVRGRAMGSAAMAAPGGMAAVHLSAEEIHSNLNLNGALTIANYNAPNQCVLSGDIAAIEDAVSALQGRGVRIRKLPVSCAFHSKSMAAAAAPLTCAIEEIPFQIPCIPVHANFDGHPHPSDIPAIRTRLKEHLSNPVHFGSQILSMYEAGSRLFLEIGPKEVLTGLVGSILESKPHLAFSLDGAGGGWRGLMFGLANLYVNRVPFDLLALYSDRSVRHPDECKADGSKASPEWFLDGGHVRHRKEDRATAGVSPFLTAETAAQEKMAFQSSAAAQAAGQPGTYLLDAYREYQDTMRSFVASQERILTELLNRVDGVTPSADHEAAAAVPAAGTPLLRALPRPESAPAPLEQIRQPASAAELTLEKLTELVVSVVSDRTGYPPDLLNPDHDIEAELGIDSIKRIEILMEVERRLPDQVAEALRPHMDSLGQVKSLRTLAEALDASIQGSPAGSAREEVHRKVPQEPVRHADRCPRYIMRAKVKPLPELTRVPPRGLFLVTEDTLGVAVHAVGLLRSRGADAILIRRGELGSPGDFPERVATLRMVHGPVRAIMHLAPLTKSGPERDLASWHQATQMQTRSLFQLLQVCAPDLEYPEHGPSAVAAATLFGGKWGRERSEMRSCAGGGVHGLLRTATLEFSALHSRVVDFEEASTPQQIADYMTRELLSGNEDTEAGYCGGLRFVFSPVPAPHRSPERNADRRPEPGSVVLITGGARGITARVALELARPGVTLVIVGRGETGALGDDTDTSPEAVRLLREEIIANAIARNRNLTPAKLEAGLKRRIHVRERTGNLQRLSERGAEVIYESVDVRDEEKFPVFVRSVYDRFGRIDGVIHGAGIIDDRLLKEKSQESFDEVFATKADSVFLLERSLKPEHLRWVVLFSSVSGRFGNRGQCDYAAANEILTRWAWHAAGLWPSTRVVSCSWGPWENMGMASTGVDTLLRLRDIIPIPPDEACRFLADELAYGDMDDCEVIAGGGPWCSAADTLVAERAVSSQ
jgi:acyl transferase domain-containing protein/NAD(P)H-dependent flavin oxidoreductase YrpB (nitropropane dioxygenase family)/NAD(P)-dependent dehydrogenase (short-subunit alcohol dehydrogenase family)/acyl carrier protein